MSHTFLPMGHHGQSGGIYVNMQPMGMIPMVPMMVPQHHHGHPHPHPPQHMHTVMIHQPPVDQQDQDDGR
jgi:hypothetical protein